MIITILLYELHQKQSLDHKIWFCQKTLHYSCSFLITIEIQKLLTKLSKEKGMEAIGWWGKAFVRHFYWSVTSTKANSSKSSLQSLNPFSTTYWHTNMPMGWLLLNACGLQKVMAALFRSLPRRSLWEACVLLQVRIVCHMTSYHRTCGWSYMISGNR